MRSSPSPCEICATRPASVFMIIRQRKLVAKGHICLTCFELAQSCGYTDVESVSLQEYKEITEVHGQPTPFGVPN